MRLALIRRDLIMWSLCVGVLLTLGSGVRLVEASSTSAENSVNVTCSVVENARLDGTPICSMRDELLSRGQIQTSMQLRYELVPSSVDVNDIWQLLELNCSSGLISLARRSLGAGSDLLLLDRERLPLLDFIVFVDNVRNTAANANAKLAHSLVVNVRLLVLDENDNAPLWTHNLVRVNFSESDPCNATRLFQLASDRDAGANAAVMYRKHRTVASFRNGSTLLLDEAHEPFRFAVLRGLDAASSRRDAALGQLRLLHPLDAETDAFEYRFELVAIDRNVSFLMST